MLAVGLRLVAPPFVTNEDTVENRLLASAYFLHADTDRTTYNLIRNRLHQAEKININHLNQKGESLLWLLIQRGVYDLALYIVENFREVNINHCPPGKAGETCLWLAAYSNDKNLLVAMLNHFPDADTEAYPLTLLNSNKSVLWQAASNKNWEAVWLILKRRPDAGIFNRPLVVSLIGSSVFDFLQDPSFKPNTVEKNKILRSLLARGIVEEPCFKDPNLYKDLMAGVEDYFKTIAATRIYRLPAELQWKILKEDFYDRFGKPKPGNKFIFLDSIKRAYASLFPDPNF